MVTACVQLLKYAVSYTHLQTEEDLDRLTLALLKANLLVDAIYGIGFRGGLNDFETQVIQLINWSRLPVVAVDIASGVELSLIHIFKRLEP